MKGVIAGVEALWPAFAGGSETESWLGFRPASDTGEPYIGRFEDLPLWMALRPFPKWHPDGSRYCRQVICTK